MGPKFGFDDNKDHSAPLGLQYIAAVARPAHESQILDGELLKLRGGEILDRLQFVPDMIGIGGNSCQAPEAADIAQAARERFPAAKIIRGGVHATVLGPEVLATCPAVDGAIAGPAEMAMKLLADGADFASVPRLTYRKDGGIVSNPPGKDMPADQLPLPARDLVNDYHYHGTSHRTFRQIVVLATRGCPFRCSFCSNSVWGRIWLTRPIASVLEELRGIAARGWGEVYFQDDTLNADPAWATELLRAIAREDLGMTYKIKFRCDRRLVNEELMDAAAAAGVREIFFGVESGNEAMRTAAQKDLARQDVVRTIEMTRKRGILTLASFVLGLPGETRQSAMDTMNFAVELKLDDAGFAVATPFPGTVLREQAIALGLLESDRYEDLNMTKSIMRTQTLSCVEVKELQTQAIDMFNSDLRKRMGLQPWQIPYLDLEETSCREALAMAIGRGDNLGAAIIRTRFARVRLDQRDPAEAAKLCQLAIAEPTLSAYDRAKAWLVQGIALRHQGQDRAAAKAINQAAAGKYPALDEWITRERPTLPKRFWRRVMDRIRR
jgi:radical SAM superfamily enzyme YgiQ (UPF0313 family)